MNEILRGLDAHAGEQETVALALGGVVVPVIDEGPARRYATERSLRVTSTLALLIVLHRSGLATRPVEEDVALLTAGGMYLTDDLKLWTIEQVRASEPPAGDHDILSR